jgi:hypothetical protein
VGSSALRAWALDVWRSSGRLDTLINPNARVLNWVRRETLLRSWQAADSDPVHAQLLLGLATIEIFVRSMEQSNPAGARPRPDFRLLRAQTSRQRVRVGSLSAGSAA